MMLDNDYFQVEFSAPEHRAYAILKPGRSQLMILREQAGALPGRRSVCVGTTVRTRHGEQAA